MFGLEKKIPPIFVWFKTYMKRTPSKLVCEGVLSLIMSSIHSAFITLKKSIEITLRNVSLPSIQLSINY